MGMTMKCYCDACGKDITESKDAISIGNISQGAPVVGYGTKVKCISEKSVVCDTKCLGALVFNNKLRDNKKTDDSEDSFIKALNHSSSSGITDVMIDSLFDILKSVIKNKIKDMFNPPNAAQYMPNLSPYSYYQTPYPPLQVTSETINKAVDNMIINHGSVHDQLNNLKKDGTL